MNVLLDDPNFGSVTFAWAGRAIGSDNSSPFASPKGLHSLSRLSVFWLRLGLAIERTKPGHPQQNGRYERMHLSLKSEAARPACHRPVSMIS
jgi:transposase InsO family protein